MTTIDAIMSAKHHIINKYTLPSKYINDTVWIEVAMALHMYKYEKYIIIILLTK